MMRRQLAPSTSAAPALDEPLSSGEVNFLWWFIQGSVMEVKIRARLCRAWGLCERHTAAWLVVEAAFRQNYLHGPAVVYADLMARALAAFDPAEAFRKGRLARRLRSHGPCHMCELGLGPAAEGYITDERLRAGRNAAPLHAFMVETRPFWQSTVCGRCAGSGAAARCRIHLTAELAQSASLEFDRHLLLVQRLTHRIKRYEQSFRWEYRGTDTVEDRGALISAAGWCGGWQGLLALYAAGSR
jgi:hypothetical protein